ncbi:MAG: FkbM family methyltransferase [Rhodothermales bacterium]
MHTLIRRLTDSDEKTVIGRLLRLPLRLIPKRRVLTIRGGINKGRRWIAGSSLHSCWLGTYEPDKQHLVAEIIRPGMVVWDVGANAGFYTVAFSHLAGDSGAVYAFEPFAENADNILRHMRLNRLQNTTLVQAAVGEHDGLVGFQTAELNAMGRISHDETNYLVPSLTVDAFIRQYPTSRPDVMKIDVEGAEEELLKGARTFLAETSPTIILALHGEEQSQRCYELLTSIGYSVFYLNGSEATELPLRSNEVYAQRNGADNTIRADSGAA